MNLLPLLKHAKPPEEGWQIIKTSQKWAELHEVKGMDFCWFSGCYHKMYRLTPPEGDPVLLMHSDDICDALGVRSDNGLRMLRGYMRDNPDIRGRYMHVYYSGGRTVSIRGVVMWVPVLQSFVQWLITSLNGHQAVQQRRWDSLAKAFGRLSGLNDAPLQEPMEKSVARMLLGAAAQGHLSGADLQECDTKHILPPLEFQTQLPLADTSGLDLMYDLERPQPWSVQGSGRISLKDLARKIRYSVSHLRRSLISADRDNLVPDGDFLKIATDNTVSTKTAFYATMLMTKALPVRLELFNVMYARLQQSPTTPQGLPQLPDGVEPMSFLDPVKAAELYNHLHLMSEQQAAVHASTVASVTNAERAAFRQVTELRAELAGKEEQILQLRSSIGGAVAAGDMVRSPEADDIVRYSGELRREFGYVTMNDVTSEIRHKLQQDKGRMEKFLGVVSGLHGGVDESIRKVVRWVFGYKMLLADDKPVLRPEILDQNYAVVHRVWVSSNTSAASRAKHGVEQKWRWQVFFTRTGANWILDTFDAHLAKFAEAGFPAHMLRPGTADPVKP